jgi:hypothetical protein
VLDTFDALDTVARVLGLVQIENELRESNDQFSAELEFPISNIAKKNEKASDLNKKRRTLAHLNNLIAEEENEIEELSNFIESSRQEMTHISSSCLKILDDVRIWLNSHESCKQTLFDAMYSFYVILLFKMTISIRNQCESMHKKLEIRRLKMLEKIHKIYPINADLTKVSIRGVAIKNGMELL